MERGFISRDCFHSAREDLKIAHTVCGSQEHLEKMMPVFPGKEMALATKEGVYGTEAEKGLQEGHEGS